MSLSKINNIKKVKKDILAEINMLNGRNDNFNYMLRHKDLMHTYNNKYPDYRSAINRNNKKIQQLKGLYTKLHFIVKKLEKNI